MQTMQITVLEGGDRIVKRLQPLAQARSVWLRPIRQFASIMSAIRKNPCGVLVLNLGRDLERELSILQTVARTAPDIATVVVGESDYPSLAGLVWDLGATYALFPPQPLEVLPDVVESLLPNHE